MLAKGDNVGKIMHGCLYKRLKNISEQGKSEQGY